MQPAGHKTIALWREAGEWWSGEPSREVRRSLDERGIRHEEERQLPCVGQDKQTAFVSSYDEDQSEEWSLKKHKVRDEKVKRAMGLVCEAPAGFVRKDLAQEPYVPLHVLSGYAFGRGTMLAEEIPAFAAHAGVPALAITDPFSLVGAVEFSRQAKKFGVKPLIGASFEMEEGGELVLIAKTKSGYQSLSKLITACHLEEPRLFPLCNWEKLKRCSTDLLCLTGGDGGMLNRLVSRRKYKEAKALVEKLIALYGRENVFIEIERSYLPWDISVNDLLLQLAEKLEVIPVAGGMITHARRDHFPVQDILVCSETLCVVDDIVGRKPQRHPSQPALPLRPGRALNAERFLRTSAEMCALFNDKPNLLKNTLRIADICEDDVLPLRTMLPKLYADEDYVLREYTLAGALMRHRKISPRLKKRLEYELNRIGKLKFAGHFLVMWDACRWAAEQEIQFSGRGSVVDSAVAYCLGLSRIDAFTHNLHFDRFLPEDGSKRPDIDVDFEARHRDKIRNYLTNKYGQDHVATVAAVGAYCTRGIVREVGKALGLPNELIGFLAKRIHGGVSAMHLEEALEKRPELRKSAVPRERFQWVFRLAERLMDIPRNIRSHSSGVVISSRPLAETVPVMWCGSEATDDLLGGPPNLKIIQWDKRSTKHYFDKFDILCLRGQDVLSGTQARIRQNNLDFRVEDLPLDDEETYRAMRSGELIGIPQSASPAMRQAHIRLRTENLHDASLVQAGIRPGVGGAVKLNELIARRRGNKAYTFSHPELERILGITYGITVFQEQVDQLLQSFCRCSSGEAEDMRESIHKRRKEDYGQMIKRQLIERMVVNGHSRELAEEVFDLIAGFKGYGFAQGHALAFAEVSIRSIYCQQNYPAEYFAAILSAQPAGYYGPCTLVNEARTRGVAILPPDVNASKLEFSVEDVKSEMDPKFLFPGGAIRVGLNQIMGISAEVKERAAASRDFTSFFDFAARAKPSRDELEKMILCGALDGLHPNRRAMLWAIPSAQRFAAACAEGDGLPLEMPEPEIPAGIEDFSVEERAIYERMHLDLDVKEHLMGFERERVRSRGGITTAEARRLPNGRKAIVVGNPIRLRFPPTPSGKRVVFFDLEDEAGLLNVTCFDAVYQQYGHAIVCSPYVTLIGEAQDRDGHIAFLAQRVFPYRPFIARQSRVEGPMPVAVGDFLVG